MKKPTITFLLDNEQEFLDAGSIISTMDGGLPIHVIDDYGTIKENLRKYLPKV